MGIEKESNVDIAKREGNCEICALSGIKRKATRQFNKFPWYSVCERCFQRIQGIYRKWEKEKNGNK